MKKLTIGRNNACDIVIPDTTDLVSRKQAILTYSWTGKKVLYDTSNNGTYVNGQKLENGKGIRVTRKDKVNFARVADLNWSEIKDPYRIGKIVAAAFAIVVFIILALLTWWIVSPKTESTTPPVHTEQPMDKGSTETTVGPQAAEPSTPAHPVTTPKSKKKNSSTKHKSLTPRDVQEKEINESTPIVY